LTALRSQAPRAAASPPFCWDDECSWAYFTYS
jgi:hypothetical protein